MRLKKTRLLNLAAGVSLLLCVVCIFMWRRSHSYEDAWTQRWYSGETCPTCGYDLRATPETSGPLFDRCPECGAVPASNVVREQSA
jgi:rRNA maturation protein Nop10